ncbi:MAG: hypothetical protein ACMXX8_02720 [Candidatus Woesearchaeota archaeon]
MKKKSNPREMLSKFKKNMRHLSQEELLDVIGYSFMRVTELEMLLMLLIEKKVIEKKDFEKYYVEFEKKVEKRFKELEKRKKFEL